MNKYIDTVSKSLKGLNMFELMLMASIMLLAIYNFITAGNFSTNALIGGVCAILGVFCVVLGAKGSMANWIFGILECALKIYICFSQHFYGDFLQRLFYNFPMQFIGWNKWKKRERKDDSTTIHTRYMTWSQRFLTFIMVAVFTALLALFLLYFGPWLYKIIVGIFPNVEFKTLKMDYDSVSLLWLDSFTTVMNITALVISVKAFVEQWYMWLIINVAYIVMWNLKGGDFSFIMVAQYSVYLVNSFYGIYMWHKLSKS